jgi:hypothetical protein
LLQEPESTTLIIKLKGFSGVKLKITDYRTQFGAALPEMSDGIDRIELENEDYTRPA